MLQQLPTREIYSVSRLNREAKLLLETQLPAHWVEGEISNLSKPSSGHLYFSLKDDQAQIRCAMFKTRNRALPFLPENGSKVVVQGRVSLYEPRGDYQLIVDRMEESGIGALQLAFEALKLRLQQEGLFDLAHKKPIPPMPFRIGVVTSPSGAAFHDICHVLKRRFPAIGILLYPSAVQGKGSELEIARQIQNANQRNEVDVLIVGRGGGSLEDLWAFNEEVVARAIFASDLPIISAVGHEIDFTIADYVADVRAPTPSAAAEIASPDQLEIMQQLDGLETSLQQSIQSQIQRYQNTLSYVRKQLWQTNPAKKIDVSRHQLQQLHRHFLLLQRQRLQQQFTRLQAWEHRLKQQQPKAQLSKKMALVEQYRLRMQASQQQFLQRLREQLTRQQSLLWESSPEQRIGQFHYQVQQASKGILHAQQRYLVTKQQHLHSLVRTLDAVSPLATLSRGYSISLNAQGQAIRSATAVQIGDPVETRLAEGKILSRVERIG